VVLDERKQIIRDDYRSFSLSLHSPSSINKQVTGNKLKKGHTKVSTCNQKQAQEFTSFCFVIFIAVFLSVPNIGDIQGAMSSLALWQYVQLWIGVRDVQLVTVPDALLWRWTTDVQYSSKSCYEFLFQGAIVSRSWKLNWHSWPPQESSFTFGLRVRIVVRPERGWRGGGSHTHRAARSVTSQRKQCNI
jgi:hypothetical protein